MRLSIVIKLSMIHNTQMPLSFFYENGSTAKQLALVLNAHEALTCTYSIASEGIDAVGNNF